MFCSLFYFFSSFIQFSYSRYIETSFLLFFFFLFFSYQRYLTRIEELFCVGNNSKDFFEYLSKIIIIGFSFASIRKPGLLWVAHLLLISIARYRSGTRDE